MNEMVIRIGADEKIAVEETENGVKRVKYISPEDLDQCIRRSAEMKISSGLLPDGCLSHSEDDTGARYVTLLHRQERANISYYKTEYPDFPLPQLVFGFHIKADGKVWGVKLGVTERNTRLKPTSQMFVYPFSNVNGFSLCTGNNVLPQCKSLHTLASIPHFILSMPNNNDYFQVTRNKAQMELRELFEHLKDKTPEYYYTDVLLPMGGRTLKDFMEQ